MSTPGANYRRAVIPVAWERGDVTIGLLANFVEKLELDGGYSRRDNGWEVDGRQKVHLAIFCAADETVAIDKEPNIKNARERVVKCDALTGVQIPNSQGMVRTPRDRVPPIGAHAYAFYPMRVIDSVV